MPKIKKRSSMAGVGCLIQGLGGLSLLVALATMSAVSEATPYRVVYPLVFITLAIGLFIKGSRKASWFECSDCGTKLAHGKLKVCPNCNGRF